MSEDTSKRSGRLYGVGVGPGDPELITLKARRAIEEADVIAYAVKRGNAGVARQTAEPYLCERHVQLPLIYPVTVERTDHLGGYEGALREFYDVSAQLLAQHLDAGRDVAVLCEGDPFFYGSYMYLHERLAERYRTEVIPGVTSFSAAAAAAGTPLAKRDDVLTVIPGTLGCEALAARLRDADAAVVLKLGRTFEHVRTAARRAGVQARALYVERASSTRERLAPLETVRSERVPYMSLLLVPTATAPGSGATAEESPGCAESAEHTGGVESAKFQGCAESAEEPRPHRETVARLAAHAVRRRAGGSLAVVGLGPGAPEWITPEAQAELAGAQELVGYGPYLARVPVRDGQRRHASDNREEARRARHALKLAAAGARVAVVSSGDPGIFAMASAVLEQLEQAGGDAGVEVRVIPGLSAMQAAAARAGAPLGHDFCVISLSDRLKPWEAIERRLDAAGIADLVTALYNPASRSRRDQLARARAVLLRHRAGTTPVVLARALGSAEESVSVSTLRDLDLETVDMRTLLIVGSSMTRVIRSGGAPPRVFTPRSYPSRAGDRGA